MQFKFKVFNFFERIDELLMLNNVGFEGPPLPPPPFVFCESSQWRGIFMNAPPSSALTPRLRKQRQHFLINGQRCSPYNATRLFVSSAGSILLSLPKAQSYQPASLPLHLIFSGNNRSQEEEQRRERNGTPIIFKAYRCSLRYR
jgi:hypothetical protein